MKKALILAVVLLGVQTIHSQIVVYTGQGLLRQKLGFYENETISAVDKNDHITSKVIIKTGKNGRMEICANDGNLICSMEWNNDPLGASTLYDQSGKKLGFVSYSNGMPIVHSLKNGVPELVGSVFTGSVELSTSDYPRAAAAAAFLLLFDRC